MNPNQTSQLPTAQAAAPITTSASNNTSNPPKPLSVAQLRKYPASALDRKAPPPTSSGRATVAKTRSGGPFQLSYRTYGSGPKRIVWLCGHGAGVEDYYPFVQKLGLDDGGNEYTSLLIENRGIGESEGPWSICSMDDLAYDALDILDFLGWSKEGQRVHIVGQSMGGMIAIKMAILQPSLVSSLTLISTTCNWIKDQPGFFSPVKNTLVGLVGGEDQRMEITKAMLYGRTWLEAPDVRGVFPTNGDAFAARLLSFKVQTKGAIIQSPAAMRHKVTPQQMQRLEEDIGGGRIQIVHGTVDQLLPVEAAKRTLQWLGGRETGVKMFIYPGAGHMPHIEHFDDVLQRIKTMVDESSVVDATPFDFERQT